MPLRSYPTLEWTDVNMTHLQHTNTFCKTVTFTAYAVSDCDRLELERQPLPSLQYVQYYTVQHKKRHGVSQIKKLKSSNCIFFGL